MAAAPGAPATFEGSVRLLPPEAQTPRCRDSGCALPRTPSQVSQPGNQREGPGFVEASSLLQTTDRHGSASKGRPGEDLKQRGGDPASARISSSCLRARLSATTWHTDSLTGAGAGVAERKAEGCKLPQKSCGHVSLAGAAVAPTKDWRGLPGLPAELSSLLRGSSPWETYTRRCCGQRCNHTLTHTI